MPMEPIPTEQAMYGGVPMWGPPSMMGPQAYPKLSIRTLSGILTSRPSQR